MNIKCWQCSQELDASSVKKQIYQSLIDNLRAKLCNNAKDDQCDLWWRHEDCHVIGILIEELKEKL